MESSFAVSPAQPSFSVGGVVGRTFSTWSKNLVPFALLVAIVHAPTFAFSLWNQYAVYGGYPSFSQITATAARGGAHAGPLGMSPGVFQVVFWLAMIVLMFVEIGALTYGTIQHLAGRKVAVGALLGAGFRRAWPILIVGIVSGFLITLGTVLLVVPGIIVFCALAAAVPAVVAETKGPFRAIGRSFEITKGRRFSIFVGFVVMVLVVWTSSAIAGLLPLMLGGGTASLVGALVAFVVGSFAWPLWTMFPAVVYHDLRVEKEGVDSTELAKVFE